MFSSSAPNSVDGSGPYYFGPCAYGGPGAVDNRSRDSDLQPQTPLCSIAKALPTPSFCADTDGLCSYTNLAWTSLTGLSAEDSAGEGWMSAVHPHDRTEVCNAWARFLEGSAPLWVRFRVQPPDVPTPRWVRLNATHLTEQNCAGILAQADDISDLQRTQEALSVHVRTLEMVDQMTPIGQWRVDRAGRNFWGSQTVHQLQGTEAGGEPLSLQRWFDLLLPEDRGFVASNFEQAFLRGHPVEFTARVQPTGGSLRMISVLGRAEWDLDGKVQSLFGVMRDVSAWTSPPPGGLR